MADNPTFIPAPPGLTFTLADGAQLPVVAFRVDGHDLIPYAMEKDGSISGPLSAETASAAWCPPIPNKPSPSSMPFS